MNMKKFICGLLGILFLGVTIALLIEGIQIFNSPSGCMQAIAVLVSLYYFAGAVVALYGSVILLSLSYGTAKKNALRLTSGFYYLLAALFFGISLMLGSMFLFSPSDLVEGTMCAGSLLLGYGFWRLAGYLWQRATA